MNSSVDSSTKQTDNERDNRIVKLEPGLSSSSFAELVSRLVMNRSQSPSRINSNSSTSQTLGGEKKHEREPADSQTSPPVVSATTQPLSTNKRCRPPVLKKFAHPCSCSQSSSHYKFSSQSNTTIQPTYSSPLHLYDPAHRKCLPTSRNRDMLLRDCRPAVIEPHYPIKSLHSDPCVYDDLVCDARRFKCVCKPPLHLFYETNSTFGCVPVGPTSSPDGRINCRSGHVYSVITKECQRIFDVNELPPSYTAGVSATQFSFVTIVLIWILLLVLIVTAKLKKLRASNLYRGSPASERRLHHGGANRNSSQNSTAWLHPFIAAVNGHHHLNNHRTTIDRHSQAMDESGNFTDTDLFLGQGRRVNDMISDHNFTGSQQSLNNPPPKFEEIYPSCPDPVANNPRPPSNEDLPSYDEAMKLQNTTPPDPKD